MDLRGSYKQVHRIPEGKCRRLFDKSDSSTKLVLELLICKGMVVFINTKIKRYFPRASSTGEFSDSLRSFGDCVLGKFSRQYQTHSCLNFPGCNSGLLIIASKTSRFLRQLLKDIVDERVHNSHSFGRDPCIGMNLNRQNTKQDVVKKI